VVIPAYSGISLLDRAIRSALAQNVPLEVIVINDCSPEDVDGVMAAYADDPSVVYVKNPHNLGAAQTRNRGVSLARGKYVAFLDSDDYWAENKLQQQLAVLEETGYVLCATGRELIRPDGSHTGRVIPVGEVIRYRDLLKHNSINCSSVVMLREVALEFPMRHARDSHEDYLLWLQVLQKYGTVAGINQPLLYYTASNQGKSGSKLHSAAMTWRVYRYMGFGILKSAICFVSYAFHGLWKHYFG
jgi:teichuronic acid biosynthesis glycosyltransferase TuaG